MKQDLFFMVLGVWSLAIGTERMGTRFFGDDGLPFWVYLAMGAASLGYWAYL